MFSNKVFTRLIYLISIIILLYVFKPSIFFKSNGKLRQYGIGYDEDGYKKTLYSLHIVIILLAIVIVYLT